MIANSTNNRITTSSANRPGRQTVEQHRRKEAKGLEEWEARRKENPPARSSNLLAGKPTDQSGL